MTGYVSHAVAVRLMRLPDCLVTPSRLGKQRFQAEAMQQALRSRDFLQVSLLFQRGPHLLNKVL